jgi:hypothetical protein
LNVFAQFVGIRSRRGLGPAYVQNYRPELHGKLCRYFDCEPNLHVLIDGELCESLSHPEGTGAGLEIKGCHSHCVPELLIAEVMYEKYTLCVIWEV